MTEHAVDELLERRVDGEIESVSWTHERGHAKYGLVVSHRENATVALTQVLLDTEDDTVRVLSDNSLWLPDEPGILDVVTRAVARSASRSAGTLEDDVEPMTESLLPFDADEIGEHVIDDEYEPASPDSGADWKESEGADEQAVVHTRLRNSPIENADRLIRLEFGAKAPWHGENERVMRPPSEIGGNYGVECRADDDLVILDVDEPGAPTDEFPETLRVESPHDGEHYYLHVPDAVDHFRERFDGVENPHPSWGECRAGDGYVVGPGSTLDDCKHEDCCTEDEPGRYVLDDAPIATVDAETVSAWLADARGEQA
jgi:hypothetical protein